MTTPQPPDLPADAVSWHQAWQQALYGPAGFYRRPEGPAGHFRTAAHAAAPELATALRRFARELGCTSIVDIGAGRGELLRALQMVGEVHAPGGISRAAGIGGTRGLSGTSAPALRLHGVDVVSRPQRLAPQIGWSQVLAAPSSPLDSALAPDPALQSALDGALVIAWELLDVVPCTVLEMDDEGSPRQVLVQPSTGREWPGAPAVAADLEWCRRWWPLHELSGDDRVEVGRPRDLFWAGIVERAVRGRARALLAVDYAHEHENRPAAGSLTGFKAGRAVPPRPDGSMDLTAHVAIDAVAAAGLAAGALPGTLTTQRSALHELGVRNRELLDPGALGGFAWLLQQAPG